MAKVTTTQLQEVFGLSRREAVAFTDRQHKDGPEGLSELKSKVGEHKSKMRNDLQKRKALGQAK